MIYPGTRTKGATFSPNKLSLYVQYASTAEHLPTRPQFRRWIKAALRQGAAMTLRIVDEAEGRDLNKNYRGKDYATNVLTFVYDKEQPPDVTTSHSTKLSKDDSQVAGYPSLPNPSQPPLVRGGVGEEPVLSGDLVICAPVTEREAREQHKDLTAHYAHLTVHAVLHLQGYEHDDDDEAAAMEARETAIMTKLGYADPYQAVTL